MPGTKRSASAGPTRRVKPMPTAHKKVRKQPMQIVPYKARYGKRGPAKRQKIPRNIFSAHMLDASKDHGKCVLLEGSLGNFVRVRSLVHSSISVASGTEVLLFVLFNAAGIAVMEQRKTGNSITGSYLNFTNIPASQIAAIRPSRLTLALRNVTAGNTREGQVTALVTSDPFTLSQENGNDIAPTQFDALRGNVLSSPDSKAHSAEVLCMGRKWHSVPASKVEFTKYRQKQDFAGTLTSAQFQTLTDAAKDLPQSAIIVYTSGSSNTQTYELSVHGEFGCRPLENSALQAVPTTAAGTVPSPLDLQNLAQTASSGTPAQE